MTDPQLISSGEKFAAVGRGITLCYERLGPADGEPLLLIGGLGQQLPMWPDGFCAALVAEGFALVRFDNRDVGRSTHCEFAPPSLPAMLAGRRRRQQYNLADLARDASGLLDELGWSDAHIVGVSMGGMIAQTLAAHAPERVRSLTSIMSTTGARRIGRPAPSTWLRMAARPARDRSDAGERTVRFFAHIGSQGFPQDADWLRTAAETAWDRDPSPHGTVRQLAAILASGDRTRELADITAPTLVIHGDRDRMVNPTGATATVRAIPGARLATVRGMGHDLPSGAWPQVVELVADHARRATTTTAQPDPYPAPAPRSDDAPITA